MANLFVLNVAGMVAPLAADKNANRLIGLAVQRLAGDAAPAAVEVPDGDALRAALFTRVAAGEVAAADAALTGHLARFSGCDQLADNAWAVFGSASGLDSVVLPQQKSGSRKPRNATFE